MQVAVVDGAINVVLIDSNNALLNLGDGETQGSRSAAKNSVCIVEDLLNRASVTRVGRVIRVNVDKILQVDQTSTKVRVVKVKTDVQRQSHNLSC